MESTHFIEVFKRLGIYYCSDVKAIESLQTELFLSDFDIYTKTIAVWRIKPTDVPIIDRMDRRGFYAMCYLDSPDDIQYVAKPYSLTTKITQR